MTTATLYDHHQCWGSLTCMLITYTGPKVEKEDLIWSMKEDTARVKLKF